MGLTEFVNRLAVADVHVFIVEIPGYSRLRMHAEAAITARGWTISGAPADTDALLVCGEPPESFFTFIDAVWDQIPRPRHYAEVATTDAIANVLDAATTALRWHTTHAGQPPARLEESPATSHDASGDHPVHGHTDTHDQGGQRPDHGGDSSDDAGEHMDMAGMDMAGMDMDMSGPAGIPLASGNQSDRDGLEMDVTHLMLGPILPDWPAGLVVECTLHGDVIADAAVEQLRGRTEPTVPSDSVSRAAELCDAAGRLLAVAGWDPVAAKVRRVRHDVLTGGAPVGARGRLDRAARQVARSRTLRWSLRGMAKDNVIDPRARLLGWLHAAAALLADVSADTGDPATSGADVASAPAEPDGSDWPGSSDDVRAALIGQELSGARILVAAITPSGLSRISDLSAVEHD